MSAGLRQEEPDGARLRRALGPRTAARTADLQAQREGGRRPDGAVVRRARCEGFVLGITVMPVGYEDVVRIVVPELPRRGLNGIRA